MIGSPMSSLAHRDHQKDMRIRNQFMLSWFGYRFEDLGFRKNKNKNVCSSLCDKRSFVIQWMEFVYAFLSLWWLAVCLCLRNKISHSRYAYCAAAKLHTKIKHWLVTASKHWVHGRLEEQSSTQYIVKRMPCGIKHIYILWVSHRLWCVS